LFFRTFISNFASESKQIVNFRGQKVPYFIDINRYMIDKKTIIEIIENEIADSDLFLVEVSVSSGNAISVVIDSFKGVPIITCIELSKAIEGKFDREVEDFELQVASAGVVIDSFKGVPIITCIELSKAIEGKFDREVEDFELQVASAGIGQPFQVFKQYHKYIDKDVEVLTTEGIKFSGKLITVGDNEIEIEVEEMEKVDGKKKKQLVVKTYSFTLDQIKSTKDIITF